MPENHENSNVDFHLDQFATELSTSNTVFCVSTATEAALHATYPSTKSKTRLLYQYADWPEEFEEIEKNLAPPIIGPYVVVIGTIEPRKNLALLIRALAEPAIRDSAIKFVIIGKKGWMVDSFLAELPPESKSRLLFTGFVTELTKYRLIRHCEFMIFPSLYEGFGIPALEAMSVGKPVLASMTTSFPEVIGDGGIYFDPYSASELALAFEEICNVSRKIELSKKAVAHAATFNAKRLSDSLIAWIADQSYSTTLEFSEALPDGIVLRNFCEPELDFVWSESNWAEIVFPFNSGKKVKTEMSDLVIDCDVFKSPMRELKQSVFFYLNGLRIGSFDISRREIRVIMFPTSLIRAKDNSLTFDTPESSSPSSIGVSDDKRRLGIQVFSVQIQPA
jgi:hypothetical protein